MRRLLAFTLHATAAGIMAWGWFSLGVVATVVMTLKGGYFLFLTNQGLVIAWLYMAVSLLDDVLPRVAIVRATKKSLLMISMPLAFVITTIYWSLLLSFPHLIARKVSSEPGAGLLRLPLSLDLALHASPLATLLIDFFVFEPKFSKTYVRRAPVAVIAFAVWYASYIEYYSPFNNSFPYPFLTYSPFPVRVLIYATVAGVALGCFRVLNAFHP